MANDVNVREAFGCPAGTLKRLPPVRNRDGTVSLPMLYRPDGWATELPPQSPWPMTLDVTYQPTAERPGSSPK
jgi:hypothetical protein